MDFDLSLDEVFEKYESSKRGLSDQEVLKRRETYGKNIIEEGKKLNPLKLLIEQFSDLLVLILIAAGIITAFLAVINQHIEEFIDVFAIGIVVLLNAFLGFYQEYSAEKAISALLNVSKSDVTVIRNNMKMKISSDDLVPGDVVVLEAGNTIPADLRVIEAFELKLNEGILTGESLPVRKKDAILDKATPLAERINLLFKGTTIATGSGTGMVITIGSKTELGKIATSLAEIEPEKTLLQKKLAKLAKQLTVAVVVLALIILLIGIFLGEDFSQMLIFSIGLAVAAVPEGLPAVLTLSLAIAIGKMAKKRSLIRRLPAVEVLGSATVICTDKTGTLTKNEMTVKQVWTNDHLYNVTGTGYKANGDIINNHTGKIVRIDDENELKYLLAVCLLCNDSSITAQGDNSSYKIFGDPTEVSLLILGVKVNLTIEILEKTWDKIFVFPFDSDRKLMSIIVRNKSTKEYYIMTKGAADVLLDLCINQFSQNTEISLGNKARDRIKAISEGYSRNYAYRNLGIAMRKIDGEIADRLILTEDHTHVERELTFLGLVSMIDPPREQSGPAISRANKAGINVIMITGDHKETANAIGRSIGLVDSKNSNPITGIMLDRMDDKQLNEAVKTTKIFARVSPNHKLRIVNALKANEQIVIMTGDGVNDAPALKRADVGVAMGITGTDVAKEASSMILIDDNFANIVESVNEGRVVYDNMKKFIAFLLSANSGEVLTVLLGLIIGIIIFHSPIIPLLAIQLLFINLVTDTFPALALGIDTPEEDVMKRPPRDPNESLLDRNLLSMIFLSGISFAILSMICFFAVYNFSLDLSILNFREQEEALRKPITMAFAALIIYQLIHAINTSENRTIFSKETIRNKALFGSIIIGFLLLIAAIYVPLLNDLLHTQPLSALEWGVIFFTSIPIIFLEEIRKKIIIRNKN
ncbi:MAG: cation-translocating P-type ATPase [Candidatus Thorarchaeota archaeon]